MTTVTGVQVPIQLVMTVDPDRWARASGAARERTAQSVADYVADQLRWSKLILDTGSDLVVKVADVTPPAHKAQGAGDTPK